MARFDHDTYRSLNESIAHVQNPQAALNEALEYTALLEEVLLALCEELDIDPQALMEDIQTAEREREMRPLVKKARKTDAAATRDAWREMKKGERGGKSYSWKAFDKVFAKHRKKYGINAKGGSASIIARDNTERSDATTLYGKGGKKVATRKPTTGYSEWKPTKRKRK